MKISYNWLNTYLNTGMSPQEIGEILTATGLEVESIEKIETVKGGLEGVLIGEVIELNRHPDADRLRITKVNIGSADLLQIVCGAPNVAAGQKVLVATVGSTLYPAGGEPLKIKKSKIRGVESEGMICAEDELGIGESHDGIMILPSETIAGQSAREYLKIEDDYVLEIGLTPNRSDAMSHIGVARDLKAYLNFHKDTKHSLTIPKSDIDNAVQSNHKLNITVENPTACLRYAGAILTGIKISESPDWLKNRLRSIGLKPINNAVDITNFVMHETGNPLHAFDLKIAGDTVIVRNAKAGEKITTLDGIERKLYTEDLVICNSAGPMCIAGVMGGADSGITENTQAIFLEAACFSTQSVRKTGKRHTLNSDSSFRFERGVDPNNVIVARDRAIQLLTEICGGKLESVYDLYPTPVKLKTITVEFDKCRAICGKNIPNGEIISILTELEFHIQKSDQHSVMLEVSAYRYDVLRPADIYEEILRIYGFNNIDLPQKLNSSITYSSKPDQETIVNLISDLLVSSGYFEIMNNSLSSSEKIEKSKSNYLTIDSAVKILNPLSNELNVLRQSMIEGGLAVIEFNQNRQNPDLKLFELGKVYRLTETGYAESKKLAIFLTGKRYSETWTSPNQKSTYFAIKSTALKILERLGLIQNLKEDIKQNKALEDGVLYSFNQTPICEIGWIDSKLLKESGVKQQVFYAEFDWENLMRAVAKSKTEFKVIPKTQFVRRDFSLLLDEKVTFESIKKTAQNSTKKILKDVGLFDVYEGKNLAPGKKSYAISFTFQDDEKTLQDDQVDKMMSMIREKLESELGAELR
jgi:phenylalanyl-tRNA synthetase beta chain